MLSTQKLVHFVFPAGLAVLNLLTSVESAHDHTRMENIRSSHKHKIHKVTPEILFEIKLHGILLWASVGFLMPVAILTKRMSNRVASSSKLRIICYIHAITQVFAVFVATAGGAMSLQYFDNSFKNDHQRIGLVFYVAIWLQALVGIFRPHSRRKGRCIWFLFHWLGGIAFSLLGFINIYTGLQAYHKRTSEDVRIWTMLFTVEISLILLAYLLQEKWQYIQKRGAVLGNEPVQPTDQDMSPRCLEKYDIL